MPLAGQDQLNLSSQLSQLANALDTPQPLTTVQRGEFLTILIKLLEQFGPVLIQLLIDLFLKEQASK